MKLLLILFLLSPFVFAGGPEIGPGQKSFIRISSVNQKDTLRLSLTYFPILPPDKITVDTVIAPGSVTTLNPDVFFPVEAYVDMDSVGGFPLFLVPGDTLEVSVDFGGPAHPEGDISFSGRQAVISQYILDRNDAYPFRHFQEIARYRSSDMNLSTLAAKMDSLERAELSYLEEYNKRNPLPAWYHKTERAAIIYSKAERKYVVPGYRKKMLKREEEVPSSYFAFWERLPLDNSEALYSLEYLWYINAYFYQKYLNREGGRLDKKSYFKKMFVRVPRLADSLLSPEVASVYLSYQFAVAIQLGFADLYDSLAAPGLSRIRDDGLRKILSVYRREKYSLKSGDIASNFYLPNEEGDYFNLSDFRGRLVLLNFWFPGCAACIVELPYERDLYQRFENRDFMLINICLNRTRETVWKAALQKFDMRGLNLWANGNWSDIITQNYAVTSFPRYVLIGKEGKVLDPQAPKPSKGLSGEIEKYLDKKAR